MALKFNPITGALDLVNTVDFSADTLHVLKTGDTMSGQLAAQAGVIIGQPGQPTQSLVFWEGSNGTAGQQVSIRGDYDNLYFYNPVGHVVLEHASSEAYSLYIQESNPPYEGISWWFDGSSATGTGLWMKSAYNSGNITMQVHGPLGTYSFYVADIFGTPVAAIASDGSAIFNSQSASVNLKVQGSSDPNTLFVQGSTNRVGIGMNNPSYKLDVTGDLNVSGVHRTGGTAGVSGTITLAKLTSGGTNGSATVTGGIITAITNAT